MKMDLSKQRKETSVQTQCLKLETTETKGFYILQAHMMLRELKEMYLFNNVEIKNIKYETSPKIKPF